MNEQDQKRQDDMRSGKLKKPCGGSALLRWEDFKHNGPLRPEHRMPRAAIDAPRRVVYVERPDTNKPPQFALDATSANGRPPGQGRALPNRYDTTLKNATREQARRVRQWSKRFDAEIARCAGCREDRITGGSGMCFDHRLCIPRGASA